jgi:hypothetical protein
MLGNERGHHCIGQIVEVFGDAGRHLAVLCAAIPAAHLKIVYASISSSFSQPVARR